MNILVAEDEPELLRFYKVLLEDLGHDVVTARDGQECLDAYRRAGSNKGTASGGFELVILDHRMPRMNGMEVAREIAATSPRQKLLMITAYAGVLDPAQKPENLKIMSKPFDVDELIATIKNMMQ